MKKTFSYRLSQLLGFLLGARVPVTALLAFALYVSTFFLFNQEESLRAFVFDLRVHGIIFCAILSILAGGIINQFYDREKDQIVKPFRSRIQNFFEQKYFLYAYIILNAVSLSVAAAISIQVFFFFLIYQFLMWLYSHKLSRLVIINNFTFVLLSLYPFFGMLVYYRTFSVTIFLMSLFLFFLLLVIDIVKDMITRNADRIFGYNTIPNSFSPVATRLVVLSLLVVNTFVAALLFLILKAAVMQLYFLLSVFVFAFGIVLLYRKRANSRFLLLNLFRLWIFAGVLAMLLNGIRQYLD